MKIILMFILTGLSSISLFAQQTVSTAGGNATGGGGTVSYTVGQVDYSNSTGSNGSVTQGVQQPYEISVLTGTDDSRNISLEMSVYPNPATDYLILKIGGEPETQYVASLYNINGNLLQTIKVNSNETTISMQNQTSGTYLLKIIQANKEIKTFKIIKN